jgi:PAS domain S-box-containing protein
MYSYKPEMFNQISAASRQIFFDCNAATGEVHWIGPTESMLGVAGEKMPDQVDRWMQWIHADDQAGLLQKRLVARDAAGNGTAAESIYKAVYRFQHKEGGWIWLQESCSAAVDQTTQTVHWYGALEDIGPRRQIEKDLLQYRFALDHASDAIFITDLQGIIQYVNPAFEKTYGYTRHEAIGQTPRLIKSGLIPQEKYSEFWHTLLDKQVVTGEIVNKAKDGRLVPVEGTNTPILDAAGEIVGFMAAHRDVTERKQSEEQMEERMREINTLFRAASQEGWKMVLSQETLTPAYRFSHDLVAPAEDLWTVLEPVDEPGQNQVAAWRLRQAIDEAVEANTLVHGGEERPFAVAPLAARGGNVIGALGVQDDPQNPLSEDELALIEQISEQVTLALESSRLFTQTQAALAETRELYNVASRISAAKDLHEIVSAAAEEVHISDMNRAVLMVLTRNAQGEIRSAEVRANWYSGEGNSPTPVGTQYTQGPTSQDFNQYSLREPMFVDVTDEFSRQRGIGSMAVLPLWVGGQQTGSLILQGDRPHAFTDQEKRPMNALAQQVAIAMQSRLLFEQMERGREQLSDALRIANMGYLEIDLQSLDVILSDEYYRLLHTTSEQEGGFQMKQDDFIAKFVLAEHAETTKMAAENAIDAKLDQFETEIQVVCADGQRRWLRTQFSFVRNEEGMPIRLLGAAQDITERKQTREALARRARELTIVADLGTQISAVLDPVQLLQSVVDLVRDNFNLYHSHIYLLGERGDMLNLVAGAGEVGRKMMSQGWQIPLEREKSLVARAARNRQGVIVNDVYAEEGYLPNELLPNTRSELAVPLMVGERVLGVLDIQSDEFEHFTEEDIAIQTVLASQVAVALQNARTYAQTQRQAEYEALINSISQKIQSTTSVENALQVAVRELGRALGASRTSVQLSLGKKGLKSG